MGAAKVKYTKDWLNEVPKTKQRQVVEFDSLVVTKSEDLPELMTTKEAAKLLRCHPKTVEEYRRNRVLKFVKIKGRYFTTPEFIAQFIEFETQNA